MGNRMLCKICVVERGCTIKDSFETEEELFNHIEMEHDIVVQRDGETEEEAWDRVKKKNPRIGAENCQCPDCKAKRRECTCAGPSHSCSV